MNEEKEEPKTEKSIPKEKLVAVRVRGITKVRKDIKDTLDMLRLYRRNYCVILPNTPSILGMLKKSKDYIAWGTLNSETEKLLIEKRQEKTKLLNNKSEKGLEKTKSFQRDKKGKEKIKPFFRLNSPKKGYAKKNIKTPFSMGGALGDRKEKINELIKRMV